MKKYLLLLLLFILLPMVVHGEENNITEKCNILVDGKKYNELLDGDYTTAIAFNKDQKLEITCEENIQNIYLYYHIKSSKGTLNEKVKVGQNNYLHELIKLSKESKSAKIVYDEDYALSEIYVFGKGDLPSWVENWQNMDDADLMLISSHADDEQLFFAGLMPLYVDRGKKIQVVYFTNHFNNQNRYHEILEGLWTIGVKYYPVMSQIPDEYSESLEEALSNMKAQGFSEEDAIKFLKDQIIKYKPEVVVGHDENGEYGHGQHMLSTYLLKTAIKDTEIKKLYLHLYKEKQITLDYDTPLKTFNGKTAYEVSKEGFKKHLSQQYTWFTSWLNGPDNSFKKATEIKEYNPAIYGLYYSSVGDDSNSDLFDNVSINKDESVSKSKTDTKKDTIIIKKKKFRIPKVKFGKFQAILSGVLLIDLLIIVILLKANKKRK